MIEATMNKLNMQFLEIVQMDDISIKIHATQSILVDIEKALASSEINPINKEVVFSMRFATLSKRKNRSSPFFGLDDILGFEEKDGQDYVKLSSSISCPVSSEFAKILKEWTGLKFPFSIINFEEAFPEYKKVISKKLELLKSEEYVSLTKEIVKIREEKNEQIKKQLYEEASKSRTKERQLLKQQKPLIQELFDKEIKKILKPVE